MEEKDVKEEKKETTKVETSKKEDVKVEEKTKKEKTEVKPKTKKVKENVEFKVNKKEDKVKLENELKSATKPGKSETKKKKKTGLVVTIIILVVLLLGVAGTVIYINIAPAITVATLFNSLSSGDFDKSNQYIIDGKDGISNIVDSEEKEQTRVFFDKLEYKIKSVKMENNTAKVEVEVTTKNFGKAFSNYVQKVTQQIFSGSSMTTEDSEKYLLEELKSMTETVTNTKALNLQKVDNKWKVKADDNYMALLLPGLNEILESFGA